MDLNTIKKELRKRMKENGLSVKNLAEEFNVPYTTVASWFSEGRDFPRDRLFQCADLVNAEIVIQDKGIYDIMPYLLKLRAIEERDELYKINQALSILSDFLKEN